MNPEKVEPIKKYVKKLEEEGWQSIVGIGIEETDRIERLHKRNNQISLLEQYGYTCQMAKELCKKYGLLSPLYEMGGLRQGCFFCPNAHIEEFAKLQKNYPHLWKELLDLNELYRKDSTQFVAPGFKYGKSFDEIIKEVETINNQLTLFDFIND